MTLVGELERRLDLDGLRGRVERRSASRVGGSPSSPSSRLHNASTALRAARCTVSSASITRATGAEHERHDVARAGQDVVRRRAGPARRHRRACCFPSARAPSPCARLHRRRCRSPAGRPRRGSSLLRARPGPPRTSRDWACLPIARASRSPARAPRRARRSREPGRRGREGRVLVRGVEHRAVHEDGPRCDGEIGERDLRDPPSSTAARTRRARNRFESGGDALGVECRRADREHRNGAELVGHEQRDRATGRDDLVGLGVDALGGEARRLLLARVDGVVRDEAERDAGRAQRLDGLRRARNGVIARRAACRRGRTARGRSAARSALYDPLIRSRAWLPHDVPRLATRCGRSGCSACANQEDVEEIRAAWKERVAQAHPDRRLENNEAATRLTAAFNDARDICERWAASGLPWPEPGPRVMRLWEPGDEWPEDDRPPAPASGCRRRRRSAANVVPGFVRETTSARSTGKICGACAA